MADPIPVVPTLHDISTPVLTNVGDQMAYLIRWYFANPGRTSSNNEDELISFRKIEAKFGNRPDALCEAVADALVVICRRYAEDVQVTCTPHMEIGRDDEEINPLTGQGVIQGNYTMEISITDSKGEPIIPHRTIQILKNGHAMDVTFQHNRKQ